MKQVPLNKYLADAGISSRRKAIDLIKDKKVLVNNEVIIDPGYKVTANDTVVINGQKVKQQKMLYILLNKPKNCVSTVADERGRKTVIDCIGGATDQRIYPVGRLDRNSTGLLLLTNDGALAQRLMHPKYNVKKVYHVTLDRILSKKDITAIRQGIQLEDGLVQVDYIEYLLPSKKKITITLHSGKYRVIRRMFKHLGYMVIALDRVKYAHFTKNGLPRGSWRMVTQEEIRQLCV